MLSKDLQIHKDCVLLLSLVDDLFTNMRRDHKFSLGQKMFDIAFTLPLRVNEANRAKGEERREILARLLLELEQLHTLNAYCHQRKYTNLRLATRIEHGVEVVAKQATGWRNSTRR